MRIGGLDRKIQIQFRSVTQNNYGEATPAFNTSFSAWARIDTKATGAMKIKTTD